MKEIDNASRAKIFAPYVGAVNVRMGDYFTEEKIIRKLKYEDLSLIHTGRFPNSYIEVTPLDQITDEDAKQFCHMNNYNYDNDVSSESVHDAFYDLDGLRTDLNHSMIDRLDHPIRTFQFLQQRGYALNQTVIQDGVDILTFTVEELIDAKVFKYKE